MEEKEKMNQFKKLLETRTVTMGALFTMMVAFVCSARGINIFETRLYSNENGAFTIYIISLLITIGLILFLVKSSNMQFICWGKCVGIFTIITLLECLSHFEKNNVYVALFITVVPIFIDVICTYIIRLFLSDLIEATHRFVMLEEYNYAIWIDKFLDEENEKITDAKEKTTGKEYEKYLKAVCKSTKCDMVTVYIDRYKKFMGGECGARFLRIDYDMNGQFDVTPVRKVPSCVLVSANNYIMKNLGLFSRHSQPSNGEFEFLYRDLQEKLTDMYFEDRANS